MRKQFYARISTEEKFIYPNSLRELFPQVTYKQFLISLLIVSAIPYLIALLARGSITAVYLLLAFQVVMLINVFAHSLMALFLGGYAPGLVSHRQ